MAHAQDSDNFGKKAIRLCAKKQVNDHKVEEKDKSHSHISGKTLQGQGQPQEGSSYVQGLAHLKTCTMVDPMEKPCESQVQVE